MTITPGTPTVVTAADMAPAPRATITVVPGADNTTITVWRLAAGGKTPVRDAYQAPVAGTFIVIDYEIPLGQSVTYSATGYNAAGDPSPESGQSIPVTIGWTGCPIWQDPVDATTAIIFSGLADWPQRVHTRDQEVLWPIGSDVATVLTGPRRQPASVQTVLTRDAGQMQALQGFADIPVVLIRTNPAWRWQGGYFCIDQDLTETPARRDLTDFDELWEVGLIPAAPPPPQLVAPRWTWDDVVAIYAGGDWDDVVAAKTDWNALVINPNPGA